MDEQRNSRLLFSMALYALAFFLTQIFHEFGHTIVGFWIYISSAFLPFSMMPKQRAAFTCHALTETNYKSAGWAFGLFCMVVFWGRMVFDKGVAF